MESNHIFQVTGKITHNISLETVTRTSAVAAEKDGFLMCLEKAMDEFVLMSVTTDGNISIRAHMRDNEPDVIHSLDVWHLCKNLTKNLVKKAKGVVSYSFHFLSLIQVIMSTS